MVRSTLVLSVAATLLTSCVGSTEVQVLERANREAKAAGYDLRVGDHFTVYVPNRGGEVELMPGR